MIEQKDIYFQSSDEIGLFAKQFGESDARQTVLCLHGLTRNHKDFEPMISALTGDRRYIAWDTRGRGRSARASEPSSYDLDVYVSDVLKLIDHLDIERFALIGTSMGGLISMRLMTLIPERITCVVLNDIGPRLEQKGLDRIASYVGTIEQFDSLKQAAAAIRDVQGSAFPDYAPGDWTAFAERTMKKTDKGYVFDYDPTIADSLTSIRIDPETETLAWRAFEAMRLAPLLVVRGDLSDLLSAKTAERMIGMHPQSKLVTVPRVGHAPLLDEPNVVHAIEEFLSQSQELSGGIG